VRFGVLPGFGFFRESFMTDRCLRDVVQGQNLITGTETMSVREAACRMVEFRVGALPVIRDGQMVGIFTERDALARVLSRGLDPDQTQVGQVMTHNPLSVAVDQALSHALLLMRNHGIRHLPVTEGPVVIGVVTTRDALAEDWLRHEASQVREEEVAGMLR